MVVHLIRRIEALTPFERFALAANPSADIYEIVHADLPPHARLSERVIPPPVRAACELGQREWQSRLRISALAERANLSVFHFTRLFRDVMGLTPYQYLDQLRVAHACELLADGAAPAAVAYACGFGDQSHLTKRFKRILGVTPGRFVRAVSTDESSCFTIPAPRRTRRAEMRAADPSLERAEGHPIARTGEHALPLVGDRDPRVELPFVAPRIQAHEPVARELV